MQLHSGLDRETLRAELGDQAERTWGAERRQALGGMIDQVSDAIYQVLKVPLTPLSEEPDPPTRLTQEG